MNYELVYHPDTRLRQQCEPVKSVTPDIAAKMRGMLATMYAGGGVGLAAPQVGLFHRVLVMDVEQTARGEPKKPLMLANPEIVWQSDTLKNYTEGCLSFPDVYADVKRPASVRVRYDDEHGAPQELACDGLLAVCVQHEIDHLNGVLFIDHLSTLRRDMLLRKYFKQMRIKD